MELFGPTEPYGCGMLDVGDGNQVYWDSDPGPRRDTRFAAAAR